MQRRHLWSLKLLRYPSKGLEYIKIYILIKKKIDDNSIIWVGSNFTLFHINHMFQQMWIVEIKVLLIYYSLFVFQKLLIGRDNPKLSSWTIQYNQINWFLTKNKSLEHTHGFIYLVTSIKVSEIISLWTQSTIYLKKI